MRLRSSPARPRYPVAYTDTPPRRGCVEPPFHDILPSSSPSRRPAPANRVSDYLLEIDFTCSDRAVFVNVVYAMALCSPVHLHFATLSWKPDPATHSRTFGVPIHDNRRTRTTEIPLFPTCYTCPLMILCAPGPREYFDINTSFIAIYIFCVFW